MQKDGKGAARGADGRDGGPGNKNNNAGDGGEGENGDEGWSRGGSSSISPLIPPFMRKLFMSLPRHMGPQPNAEGLLKALRERALPDKPRYVRTILGECALVCLEAGFTYRRRARYFMISDRPTNVVCAYPA